MPRVSIVMPAYNDERFIAETIQSVLDQTYEDFEFIITNNGSKDETGNLIKAFTDPRIKLLTLEKNRGHCGGMNNSIRAAKGEFLSLLNGDDLYAPNKLEKQVKFLDENPHVGIVFSYADIIDKDSNTFTGQSNYKGVFERPNQANRFNWLSYFFLNNNFLCHPSALMRKKCQEDIGFFDERYALFLDFDYWIRACLKYDIYILPERLTKFRVHENQGSAEKPETYSLHDLELTQVLKHYLSPEVLDNLPAIFSLEILKQVNFQKNMEEIDMEIEPLIMSMLKDVNNIGKELKSFFVAMLAFWVGRASHRAFGLNVLYQIYQEPEIVEKIRSRYSYDFSNLIRLAKTQDIFGRVSFAKLNTQLNSTNQALQNVQTELYKVKIQLNDCQAELNGNSREKDELPQQQTIPEGNFSFQSQQIVSKNDSYNVLIEKAINAYERKDFSMMTHYLEESLQHRSLLVTETVLDWINNLVDFSSKNGGNFNMSDLIELEEWDKLMKSVVKSTS